MVHKPPFLFFPYDFDIICNNTSNPDSIINESGNIELNRTIINFVLATNTFALPTIEVA